VATIPLGDRAPDWLVEGVAEHVRFSTSEAAYSAIMMRHTGTTPAGFTAAVKTFKG
jgi:hypothetical protein